MDSNAVTYSGQGFSLQGEKGRFVLPPDFRKAVRESGRGERVLCIAKHRKWNCLTAFGLSRAEAFESELDNEQDTATRLGKEFDRDLLAMQLYGFSRVSFDESGRFILPDRYMRLGALDDAAFFQGGGRAFTIWSPAELAKLGAGWEDAQEACADLAAQARAGKARR